MKEFEQNLPHEEILNDGQGVLIKNKTLFHGSCVSGIESFNPADESTIGEGVYLTSKHNDAHGYAVRRSRHKESEPIVYSVDIENLKFFDARNSDNVMSMLNGFLSILQQERQRRDLDWVEEGTLDEAIQKIKDGKINAGNLREVTFSHGKLFTDYIRSLGYDGLIATEGGEGDDIGIHDTYLIFDPKNIKNISTQK